MIDEKKTKEQLEAEWKVHQAEVDACDCLTPERKAYIQRKMALAADFNDGAFMAFMDESSIDVSELECFSTTHYSEQHAGGKK